MSWFIAGALAFLPMASDHSVISVVPTHTICKSERSLGAILPEIRYARFAVESGQAAFRLEQ